MSINAQDSDLQRIAQSLGSLEKVAKPIWVVVVGVLTMGIGIGTFIAKYDANAAEGKAFRDQTTLTLTQQNNTLIKLVTEMTEMNNRLNRNGLK